MYSDNLVHIWITLLGRPANKIASLLVENYGA